MSAGKHVLKLYSWPPCSGCESVYPRSVMFMRLLNLRKLPYENRVMDFPDPEIESPAEIQKKLEQMPGVIDPSGKQVFGYEKILRFIIDNTQVSHEADNVRFSGDLSEMMYQWSQEILLPYLIYARWVQEDNQKIFWKNVSFGGDEPAVVRKFEFLRKQMQTYLKRYPVATYKGQEYYQRLHDNLSMIKKVLRKKFMFSDTRLTLADLSLFSVLQGFAGKGLMERELLITEFPELVIWMKEVDDMTKKPSDPSINLSIV